MSRLSGVHARFLQAKMEAVFSRLGYAFFTQGLYNLNIIGVRSNSGSAETFDDLMLVLFRDGEDEWVVDSYVITTEPGTGILRKPIAAGGTAILVPGQYRGVYKIDTHGGSSRQYTALCQRSGPVKIWRDNDRDKEPDYLGPEHVGHFGINIHRQWGSDEREYTGSSSAGCQVFQKSYDFYEFMHTCNLAADRWGNSFTYTLINEVDLL